MILEFLACGTAVVGAALIANARSILRVGLAIRNVGSHVFGYPPFIMLYWNLPFVSSQALKIKVCATVVIMYSALGFTYGMHYLQTRECIDSDTANLYMEIARSAGDFWFLPFFFAFVDVPDVVNGEEQENGEAHHTVTLRLPGGLIVALGTTVIPGSLWSTVVYSKELRAYAKAICLYFLSVSYTILAAAAAAGVGLVAAETSLSFLTVASSVSLAYYTPRFIYPDLNTARSDAIFRYGILPAALAATQLLQMSGEVELAFIEHDACCMRDCIYVWLPQIACYGWIKRMYARERRARQE